MTFFERYFERLDGDDPHSALELVADDVEFSIQWAAGADRKSSQFLGGLDELPAGAIRAAGPLDRELDVVGDKLERRVRIGAVERGEVALEEACASRRSRVSAHAAAPARADASGATPTSARLRSVKNSAMRLRATIPLGRYQCQTLL